MTSKLGAEREAEMVKALNKLKRKSYTRLDELVEDIKDIGWIVGIVNREYILVVVDDADMFGLLTAEIVLGGTERTITIQEIEYV